LTLFLAGDVMTGRGIDQVMPHPGDPRIHERYAESALDYVRLAEQRNGPIPKPVPYTYIWGAALGELERRAPDARIINLETAVTKNDVPAPKGINYRMHPKNVASLTAAKIDCCVLGNNHLLDWGEAGCVETLDVLRDAGIKTAGAGRDATHAASPAVLQSERGRVLVFGFGSVTSGIPRGWRATPTSPGINLLQDLSDGTARRIAAQIRAHRRDKDIVVASIHWGGNWGYEVPSEQRAFAHSLIDEAKVDIVHGHSSHHPKGVEIYRGRPVLYGCGDLINDYEGISGHARYRGDLALMYFVTMSGTGRLDRLEMVPLQMRRFRLHRASKKDAEWLRQTLAREGRKLGTTVTLEGDILRVA
jgi:poly-gamma-glutamate synthesis protein (capsule biosynthesis protein)